MSILRRVTNLFHRSKLDEDIDAELRSHLEMRAADNMAAGMSPEEARRQAVLRFGSRAAMKERVVAADAQMFLDSLWQDVCYGLRMLRKSPGFTAVAILTLALGIGANTAIFTLVDALYLKPLPVVHPWQLMHVYAEVPGRSYDEGFSGPEFHVLRDHASSFTGLAGETQVTQLHVVTSGGSAEVRGAFVSANYFGLLGVSPRVGRAFLASEDTVPGRDAVVVISDQFWKTNFASSPSAIGAEIHINQVRFNVVGVAPPGFSGDTVGIPAQVWIPTAMLSMLGACAGPDGTYRCAIYDDLVGRLALGRSRLIAQAELNTLIVWSATDWVSRRVRRQLVVMSANGIGPDDRVDPDAQMELLVCVTASLLLIGCANLAGLLLARGGARRKEIAVRLSLGAGRARVIRQLLTESLILSAMAGVLGLWFSLWARNVLSGFYATDSEGFQHLYDLSLDWRILVYSICLALIAGIFFGLLPALRSSRQELVTELKEGSSPGQHAGGWLRHCLVIGQVALSVILVTSAGLLVRSGLSIERGTNFDPRHMAVLRLRPELIQYTPRQVEALIYRVMDAVRTVPSVQSAAFMEGGEGLVWNWENGHEVTLAVPGQNQVTPASGLRVQDVSPTFFATLHMPILQGRAFTEQDTPNTPRVAVVNETLAQRLWPHTSAAGQELLVNGKPYQVVGVTVDIQPASALQAAAPHLYLAYWQSNATANGDIRMAVRVAGDPSRELPSIRQAIRSADPLVPIGEDMTMSEQVGLEYMPVLLGRSVMMFCGFLALILSAIGVYSVLAFAVRMRTREIGIRIALGAQRVNVFQLIIGQGLKMALAGIVIGIIAALASARLLSSLLFGVSSSDPMTFAGVAVLLTLVALLACYIPARRAMKVDPTVALRYE